MITLKMHVENLKFRKASLVLGKSLKIVKLTPEQAVEFKGGVNSFTELLQKYGNRNILHEYEHYEGYVAVYYSDWKIDVVYMNGCLEKFNDMASLIWAQSHIREAAQAGAYYRITSPMFNNVRYKSEGIFQLVWNFNFCNFEAWAKELQRDNRLEANIDPWDIDASLKEKLQKALVSEKKKLELTDEEYLVLWSYAPDYYKQFFSLMY
jgi:hypothetical protein